MAARLTLQQMLVIATSNAVPPVHALDPLKRWGTAGQPLSLVSARNKLEATTTIFILEVRDSSILSASSGFAALQSNWAVPNPKWVPTRKSILLLFQFLNSNGVVVRALSQDWQRITLSGTATSFAALPIKVISSAGPGTTSSSSAHALHQLDKPVGPLDPVVTGPIGLVAAILAAGLSKTQYGPFVAAVSAGYVAGNGLYEATKPASGTDINYNNCYVGPNGLVMLGGLTLDEYRLGEAQLNAILGGPPMDATGISAAPSQPPQSPKETSDKDKEGKDGGKEGKDSTDSKDKDGKEGGKEGSKEGKEVTDKDKDGSKDGGKEGKDSTDSKDKDDKEISDKLKEGKDGKDDKDGKEQTDSKEKDSKEGTDSDGAGLAGSEGSAMYAKTDAADGPAAWLVEDGRTKPATLLTRSPLV